MPSASVTELAAAWNGMPPASHRGWNQVIERGADDVPFKLHYVLHSHDAAHVVMKLTISPDGTWRLDVHGRVGVCIPVKTTDRVCSADDIVGIINEVRSTKGVSYDYCRLGYREVLVTCFLLVQVSQFAVCAGAVLPTRLQPKLRELATLRGDRFLGVSLNDVVATVDSFPFKIKDDKIQDWTVRHKDCAVLVKKAGYSCKVCATYRQSLTKLTSNFELGSGMETLLSSSW